MFKHIMVPVDLAHTGTLKRSLDCASDLATHYGADITYVGVTTNAPGSIAHNSAEFKGKLEAFAQDHSGSKAARAHTVISHDPTADVDDALLKAVEEIGADLVVMASHVPGLADYLWPSNGGKLASRAKCTVMVVRG